MKVLIFSAILSFEITACTMTEESIAFTYFALYTTWEDICKPTLKTITAITPQPKPRRALRNQFAFLRIVNFFTDSKR